MMDDNDLEWLKPLALELFLPAVEIVFDGMRRKLRPYEEEFADDETHAPFTIMQSALPKLKQKWRSMTSFTLLHSVLDKISSPNLYYSGLRS